MLFSLLLQNPLAFFLVAAALVVSLTFHEFSHAFAADKLGDPTARSLGRLTLDPRAHLDKWGTLMLIFAGIGWGRPVPFNPMYLKHPKRDSAIIALAGPCANFLLAGVLAGVYHLVSDFGGGGGLLGGLVTVFLYFTILYNLVLGFFNLIPIHPLDGFKVVNGLLPYELSLQWMQMAPYGMYLLLILILTQSIGKMVNPLVDFALKMLEITSF